jgi:Ca2+-binding EF-hand superfamily protein
MSKKIMTVALVAVGIASVTGLAFAAEPYLPRGQKVFDRLDANKDGKINLAEFAPLAQKRFMAVDENKDDAVSTAEIDKALQAALERRRNRMMASMDADKNGSVTKAELDKYVEAMLTGADANKDGGVSFDEAKLFKLGKWRKTLGEPSAN